ncbi:twinfilin [Neocloeon triangulifer]|uniref:twinfilin n=1 Tax=Neocloeon triangulifer TaxID=2078957 RepID=UPI00286F2BB0|nr:twinfilin [Neocloeon triangulifer]
MSHQTGIKANNELLQFFGKCRDGKVRVFKVSIENEELILAEHKNSKGTWEQDFDLCVPRMVQEKQPCYLLYRLDTKTGSNFDWVLISWSPEDSPVRQKMLYASTKATLKQEFGSSQITEELFGTSKEDVTLQGFKNHRITSKAPAPLTFREEELMELKRNESTSTEGVDARQQTLQSVAFPVSVGAKNAIVHFADGKYNYLRLRIDLEKEEIHLDDTNTITVPQLPKQVPTDAARYHIFNFKHTHEGDFMESFVFIYSMPGYNCSIKERMLYSSCKAPLLNVIENGLNVAIAKKLEIDSGDELTEEFLLEELHPKKNLHRPQFEKPKGPPNRGAKRITRPVQGDQ